MKLGDIQTSIDPAAPPVSIDIDIRTMEECEEFVAAVESLSFRDRVVVTMHRDFD